MTFLLLLLLSQDFSQGFIVFASESLFYFFGVDAQVHAFSFDSFKYYLPFIFLEPIFFKCAGVNVFVSAKRIEAELLKIELSEEFWFIFNFEVL